MLSYNEPVGDTSLIACGDCDLVQRLPELAPGASARCPRCGKELWRRAGGEGFEALAAAHSRALAKVSGDIAAAIRVVAATKP